jgi:hypothetical protein
MVTCCRIKDQFNSAGNSNLFIDPEQMIFDRVLAKAETIGYFSIGQALGDKGNDLLLTFGKQQFPAMVNAL